ncbi:MAG: HEAT repeat domain-containing protein [Acidobacteriia bacterium]|nr:HEAT repeat domain-containing protein [Terriglobia bacterium]
MKWSTEVLVAAASILPCWAATDAQCTDILKTALQASNPDTRKQAVVSLSLASSEGPLFDQLVGMLQDKDVEVRQAVVASLAEVKNKTATEALHKALQDPVPEVSFAAAKVLYAGHDPSGRAALLAVLNGESKASSSFFSKQKREALRMMHTPRTTFLFVLREGVGFAPVPGLGQGIASMQGILTDAGVSGRASAALLMGTDKDPAVLEALVDALSDKDASVRAAAVHSIALRNDPTLKSRLEPLLMDQKEQVRLRAAAGYLRLFAIEAKARERKTIPARPLTKQPAKKAPIQTTAGK